MRKKNAFDKKTKRIIDYYTYVLVSDLMERVTYESESLHGSLKLGKLIVLYDSNKITFYGSTEDVFDEDVLGRFSSIGWHSINEKKGKLVKEIVSAIKKDKLETTRSSIIKMDITIGDGSILSETRQIYDEPLLKEDLE